MWVVDEVTQLCKEMLMEGNIHNIVVFTIITSSSVLTAVGAVRHIYTFICNIRYGRKVEVPQVRAACKKQDDFCHQLPNNLPIVASLERLAIMNYNPCASKRRQESVKQDTNKHRAKPVSSQTCLKCELGMWERHCTYGLCHACCERMGGCQGQGHEKRPLNYDPWPHTLYRKSSIVDLSHLSLSELPPRLGFHHMDAHLLDVSHNRLSELPQNLTLMRGLISLSAQHNLISYIPEFLMTLHQLSCVDLRNNRLLTFPAPLLQLPQLQKLYLDHNYLREIPYDIDCLHTLQCLSLGYNDISSIPQSLFHMYGLKSLSLRGNRKLSVLPREVGQLVSLQRLDVSRCDLHLIPSTLRFCSMLKKCMFSNNRLSHVPCEMSQCYRLQMLDVSNNRLKCLPATLLFQQGTLCLKASGNEFESRPNLQSQWALLDTVIPKDQRPVLSLKTLALRVMEKFQLDPSDLPVPLQDELSSIASCYYCGRVKVFNSFRAVRFAGFDAPYYHMSYPQWQGVPYPQWQAVPFMYTFCQNHIHGQNSEAVETCIEALLYSVENDKVT